MIPTRMLFAALLAGAASLTSAQTTPTAPATPKSADCGKARHDHGAERNTPRAKSAGCEVKTADSKKKAHDHGKVHKQQ